MDRLKLVDENIKRRADKKSRRNSAIEDFFDSILGHLSVFWYVTLPILLIILFLIRC